MFRILSISAIVVLLGTGVQAAILTIQDTTPNGNGTSVIDTHFRGDGAGDTNDDLNCGTCPVGRVFTEDNAYGTRRTNLYKFDLAGLSSGYIINSAVMSIGMVRSASTINTLSNLKLSRLRNGNSWIEGTFDLTGVNTGEPTWNSRQHNQNLWGTPGARNGTTDIFDTGNASETVLFNKSSTDSEIVNVDITAMVNAWVNGGAENNGVLFWGGTRDGGNSAFWQNIFSEYVSGTGSADITWRPKLVIDYTVPEPTSLLLVGAAMLPFMRRRRTA